MSSEDITPVASETADQQTQDSAGETEETNEATAR